MSLGDFGSQYAFSLKRLTFDSSSDPRRISLINTARAIPDILKSWCSRGKQTGIQHAKP
jgi:hypothetical protein